MKPLKIFTKVLMIVVLIVLTPLLLLALFVFLGSAFTSALQKIPVKESYYYIPEAEIYIQKRGTTVSLSKHLEALKYSYTATSFRFKNNLFDSKIFYPLEEKFYPWIYVEDPHNCMVCTGQLGAVIWLAEKETGFVVPPSVEISFPMSQNSISYCLPDGSCHQAEQVDKEFLKEVKRPNDVYGWGDVPLKILPEYIESGTIEEADIHVTDSGTDIITLHLRENRIECETLRGEMRGYYPEFYYSPQFPHFLFCHLGGTQIIFKKCEDIQLVDSNLTGHAIKLAGLKNWYKIHLNPFFVKEIE